MTITCIWHISHFNMCKHVCKKQLRYTLHLKVEKSSFLSTSCLLYINWRCCYIDIQCTCTIQNYLFTEPVNFKLGKWWNLHLLWTLNLLYDIFPKKICINMFLATYMYYKSCLNMFYILITTKPWYKLYTSDERSIWLSTRYFDSDSVFWAACSLLNRFLLSLSVDNFNRLYTHHIPEFVNKFIKFLGHPSYF